MKRCPKCGTDYPDRDSFCMECGSGLERVTKPAAAPGMKIPRALGTSISRMEGKLRVLEDEVGRLSREIQDLKAAMPEDLELFRSAVEGTAGRISSINTRIRALTQRLGEGEKHIGGIENVISELPRRQDLERLEKGMAAKSAAGAARERERLGAMERDIKAGLGTLRAGFMDELRSQLDTATKRVGQLEAELARLVGELEGTTARRIEGFKTGFNQKVNKSMLELRREVAEKTSIVEKLRENLEKQILANNERYSKFEERLKKELDDIDSFKEGMSVRQEEKDKEMRTELLEGLGEIKKLEEDLVLQQQKKMLLMEEGLREGLESLKQESRAPLPQAGTGSGGPDAGELAKLRREVEDAVKGIRQLEDDLIIQQETRLMALEERIGGMLGGLQPGKGTNIKPKVKEYSRVQSGGKSWQRQGKRTEG